MEEIVEIYSSLTPQMKSRAKNDTPKAVRQILNNMACEALPVIINGLKLMIVLAEDHAEGFLPEIHALFPKLLVS